MKVRTLFMEPVPIFFLWVAMFLVFAGGILSLWMISKNHKAALAALAASYVSSLKSTEEESFRHGYATGFSDMQFDIWRAVERMDKVVIGPFVVRGSDDDASIDGALVLCPNCTSAVWAFNVPKIEVNASSFIGLGRTYRRGEVGKGVSGGANSGMNDGKNGKERIDMGALAEK